MPTVWENKERDNGIQGEIMKTFVVDVGLRIAVLLVEADNLQDAMDTGKLYVEENMGGDMGTLVVHAQLKTLWTEDVLMNLCERWCMYGLGRVRD
jgi:hypothetical protein